MPASLRYNEVPVRFLQQSMWPEPEWRGCLFCVHGADDGHRCKHPQCPSSVAAARQRGGECGPDGKYLLLPGEKQ